MQPLCRRIGSAGVPIGKTRPRTKHDWADGKPKFNISRLPTLRAYCWKAGVPTGSGPTLRTARSDEQISLSLPAATNPDCKVANHIRDDLERRIVSVIEEGLCLCEVKLMSLGPA
jgi:hypothetical protein